MHRAIADCPAAYSILYVARLDGAGARETVAPARTDSCASTSSDNETSSGDSATSGFSSAGSDVTRPTTGNCTDEIETMTLGRAAKRPKPALKPKRTILKLLRCLSCQLDSQGYTGLESTHSIVMSMSVCCVSVCSHNWKTARPNITKYLCVLTAAVCRSFSDGVAICYVLLVLRMTSCFILWANGPESRTTLFRRFRLVTVPVGRQS